jgi:hypothetical protein
LLSVVAPVLFGLNVAGVYWFARRALDWDVKAGLVAAGFFALQLASLRISWDLLRNTLGLGLLLFTLPLLLRVSSKRGFFLFALLSLLTVFSHEFAAVALLVVSFALIFWRLVKDRDLAMYRLRVLAVSPALAVFLFGFYLRFFPVGYAAETNVISAGDSFSGSSGGLFFLVDYLSVRTSVDFYASYWALAFNVFLLFAVLYLPYLFLVFKGFFRSGVLNVWTGLLLFGAFGCLFYPSGALLYWHRWMFMLVYPFTFYAVNGLRESSRQYLNGSMHFFPRFPSWKVLAMVFLTVSLGVACLFTPLLMRYVNVSVSDVFFTQAYFSVSPAVPYEDVDDVAEAMRWLDGNSDNSSCVVLHHAFFDWGRLYLDGSHVIVHFEFDVDEAVNAASERGFNHVFFVWWNEPIGWYGITVPDSFARLQDFGRISVYVKGVSVSGS